MEAQEKELFIPEGIRAEMQESIERGMDFLDNYFEGQDWVRNIDLETLELNDCTQCVCGQLFDAQTKERTVEGDLKYGVMSGYDYALKYVLEHDTPDENGFVLASTYGFNVDDDEQETWDDVLVDHNPWYEEELYETAPSWQALTDLWTDAITKRQANLGLL